MAKVTLRAYNREIESMLDRGDYTEVVAHCHHILKTYPKHLETYRLLGKAYLEQKKRSDAVNIFSRVLVAIPSDFVSHVGMSIIRDEENKLDDAIWHMERAFETQPSNAAIQSELQRLYSRRDGVAPPRIRMTRGALAHMYVKGELYPQAISEIKGVLQEDAGRSDMEALLTRVYYKSGQKNEAADSASSLLRRYPYCYDANAVLVEILGSDHPENAQVYRQRVTELDPYAAHVSSSVLQPVDAPDSAVALERLDYSGQSVDWRESSGIGLESGRENEAQPTWLTSGLGSATSRLDDAQREPSAPLAGSVFDTSSAPPTDSASSEENIPDFLREAGWGKSTGAFDESQSSLVEDDTIPPTQAAPLTEGEMPDWIKAMAPAETLKPAGEEQEEALPDWINSISKDTLGTMETSSTNEPDWLKQSAETEQPASAFAEPSSDQPDWLTQLGQPEQPVESPALATDATPDWLKDLSGEPESAPLESSSSDFDFLNSMKEEPAQPAPSFDEKPAEVPATPAMTDLGNLGSSEKELDDSFAWLENLAAKQGASEGLLMKPEDRLEQEPDWVKQAKSLTGEAESPVVESAPPVMESTPQELPAQPVGNLDDLGKSEQERDDSFSWLESLAAKQGASEGLLTKPEDRLEQAPDWVNQAKEIGESQPVFDASKESTAMDTGTWLKSLDEEESKSVPASDETGIWLKSLDEPESKPQAVHEPAVDDTASWLRSLDDSPAKPEPTAEFSSNDDTAMWLKSLDEPEVTPAGASSQADDLPAWLQSVDAEKTESETESAVPAGEAEVSSEWIGSFDQPVVSETPKTDTGSLPSWLRGLDTEESKDSTGQGDLPSWLRDDTGEVVAEPTKIEPTRADEWQPMQETKQPEVFEAPVETPKPEPKPEPTKPAPQKAEPRPETPVAPYQEPVTRKGTGMLTQTVDMILGQARNELGRSNIPGALETYTKLIKRGRFLDEVIFDLREALYRYPVEVSIWQTLGDAYNRANRLQDALDAYTKAEELLR